MLISLSCQVYFVGKYLHIFFGKSKRKIDKYKKVNIPVLNRTIEGERGKVIISQSFFILLLGGSMFVTSSKFVNESNLPKLYFFLLLITVGGIISNVIKSLTRRDRAFEIIRLNHFLMISGVIILFAANSQSSKIIVTLLCLLVFFSIYSKEWADHSLSNFFKIIVLLGSVQASYGIVQYIYPSPGQSNMGIRGSFDNSAGYAVTIALVFPYAFFLSSKTIHWKRWLGIGSCLIMVLAILLSKSRAGLLSIGVGAGLLVYCESPLLSFFKQWPLRKRLLMIFCFSVLFAFILFSVKKDSSNGRLLIWRITWEMIKDEPLIGHGLGSFKSNYMLYQANYFESTTAHQHKHLADNVKHPFNEFLLILVESGIIGMVGIGISIFLLIKYLSKFQGIYKYLVRSILLSLFVFTMFSYPCQYVTVWILLLFPISVINGDPKLLEKKRVWALPVRTCIVLIFLTVLMSIINDIRNELKWKRIATASLQGYTNDMIPEYQKLYPKLKNNPYFLYNYGAELNVVKNFSLSNAILIECTKKLNDYDLQLLLADNYVGMKDYKKAEATLKLASNMIPNRFYPLYQLVKLYETTSQYEKARELANEILLKPVKIPSITVDVIKQEMREFLDKNLPPSGDSDVRQVVHSSTITFP